MVVLGGPGSGKSVVALSLLGELSRRGRRVLHATGSSSFTKTLRKIVVGSRSTRVQQMFVYFNSFIGEPNRTRSTCSSATRHTASARPASTGSRRPTVRAVAKRQVEELIDVARTPVFLLDEHQVVRPGEMGTERRSAQRPRRRAAASRSSELEGQYRCGGSQLYDAVGAAPAGSDLAARPCPGPTLTDDSDENYRVAALPSPEALESWLTSQNPGSGDTARIAAGYCWPWSDPKVVDGTKALVDDVVIGDWRRPWNAKPEKPVRGVPASHFWASDPRASARSAASTPRRASSTTGRA